MRSGFALAKVSVCFAALFLASCADAAERVTASSSAAGYEASSAWKGDRFSLERGSAWKGGTNAARWWWQAEFAQPRAVGAVLQVVGDHSFVFRNAPRRYVWQRSDDGVHWSDLAGTAVTNEQRLYRIHRLGAAVTTRFLRLDIAAAAGEFPTLREVEVYSDPEAAIVFPDWIVAVNVTHDSKLPNHGQEFIPLAKSAAGGTELRAQQVWLDVFNEEFLQAEPRPLCAFLSGSFKDWCEVERATWRGAQEVLRNKRLPMWASCGGAQGLAILAETGVDKPWDCPHCRDAKNPKTPIYTHIGHTTQRPCGDYSGCVFERGPHWIQSVTEDPVFQNLPREFQAMESHCGQIEWAPAGWSLIATAGQGTKTKTQCLRVNDRPIYAAQFHIEMDGAPEASRQIMGNFLALAKAWGGYNPKGQPVPTPVPHERERFNTDQTMIWIGTSGFQYKEWKGDFYPERLPLAKMLAYYSQRFPTTEINYTFRQLPTNKTLANWLAQTPEHFRFTLKALQRITDFQRLKNCEILLNSFIEAALKLGPKRGALLFQLPPQFKCDAAVLSDFLALLPPSVVAAFEFRDTSWFTDAVFDVLRRHNTALCIADTENLTTPTVFTGTTGYFRLRRISYPPAELGKWADAIRAQSSRLTDIYVYFRHEDTGTGPRLANELMKMLGVKPPTTETRAGDLPFGE